MTAAISHPFAESPPPGETVEVRPGVHWLRMPLPIPGLEHINLWLLEDGFGWTAIDTGLRTKTILELWERIFAARLGGRPVTRVLCTHFHPDHVGEAGWLCDRWQAPLWMTLGEWSFGRQLMLDAIADVPDEMVEFYRRAGFDADTLAAFRVRGFDNFRKAVTPIPRQFRRLSDGDVLRIGSHDWRVIVGRGHSPEHACLHCAELGLLISGDQVLPGISPHIGVYPGEPEANPLQQYLDSLPRFRGLAKDTLVLPAHRDPFVGLDARIDQLLSHHAKRLDDLAAALAEPMTVVQAVPALKFRRAITKDNMTLAAGETLAHLHQLMNAGRAVRRAGPDGVWLYQATAKAARAAE